MPRDRRPAAVLVVAILNMFFGGMNLLGFFCALPLLAVIFAFFPSLPGSDKNVFREMFDSFNDRFPVVYVMIATGLLSLLLNIGLLVSGFGLWKMRPWARRLAIACASVQISIAVLTLIFQILWINQATIDWQEHFNKTLVKPNAPPPPTFIGKGFYDVASVFGAVFGSIYPFASLIILFLPHVRAAFAGASFPKPQSEDDLPEVLDASIPAPERGD
jgi:hypothetical protein